MPAQISPALGPMKMRIRALMDRSKANKDSQQTRNQMSLLTQTGGVTPKAAARALVDKRHQLDRFIDKILFG
jgi:hypothetical protein